MEMGNGRGDLRNVPCRARRRRKKRKAAMRSARTRTAPITPPAIAPVGVFFVLDTGTVLLEEEPVLEEEPEGRTSAAAEPVPDGLKLGAMPDGSDAADVWDAGTDPEEVDEELGGGDAEPPMTVTVETVPAPFVTTVVVIPGGGGAGGGGAVLPPEEGFGVMRK
jgi:hypothetical protein